MSWEKPTVEKFQTSQVALRSLLPSNDCLEMLIHTDRRPPVKAVGTIFTIAMLPLRAKKFEEHKTSANYSRFYDAEGGAHGYTMAFAIGAI